MDKLQNDEMADETILVNMTMNRSNNFANEEQKFKKNQGVPIFFMLSNVFAFFSRSIFFFQVSLT